MGTIEGRILLRESSQGESSGLMSSPNRIDFPTCRKVDAVLTSGEDVLISDAHIIKNGTPAIAQNVSATLYKETKQLH